MAGSATRCGRWPTRAFVLAVLVLAWVGAHRLAYLLGGMQPDHHTQPHGYLAVLEIAAALAAVGALAWFAALARRRGARLDCGLPRGRLLGLCTLGPALTFAAVEMLEGSFSGGPELALVAGIGLQFVLGAVALAASRGVLRTVAVIARGRPQRRPRARVSVRPCRPAPAAPRVPLLATSHAGRAPPRI